MKCLPFRTSKVLFRDSTMTGVTRGAWTAYLSGPAEFYPVFLWVSFFNFLFECFVDHFSSFSSFLVVIVKSVLRFTDSDYPFGVFKLFVCRSLFVLLSFSFDHGNVCPWIYGFWLPHWYLQIVFYTYYSITLIFWGWTIDRMHIPELILKFKIKKIKKSNLWRNVFSLHEIGIFCFFAKYTALLYYGVEN
jgi:hypothetical protein